MKLYNRIINKFKESNFVSLEIIGGADTGKTILLNELLEKFDKEWIKIFISTGESQGSIFAKHTIQIYDDYSYRSYAVDNLLSVLQRHNRIRDLLQPIEERMSHKLLRIIVSYKIIHVPDSIPPVEPTLIARTSLNHDSRFVHREFMQKLHRWFLVNTKKPTTARGRRQKKKILKTKPYLIATKPYDIGYYKIPQSSKKNK